ncbi:site-specific DNA-methyltransferase [Paenibacillus phoenicis]|uniref:Site-specific DNA-methyltransferase n=1 Tax=Paenibacillus phoenicis TaxID=554117 RepID=A0ABU5PQ12_9BACL|nr:MULTISPECIES: site-specific DNA-methyltransferase [Paenibacillus]MEA3572030.1 site-specific DNA-methyltransferase [Paenibacillus phoenicis]
MSVNTLVDKLKSYSDEYWDFTGYRDRKALIKYPAMMVAPMQEQLLQDILEFDTNIRNILDPFVGSGTVLAAGAKHNLTTYGIDINPLAILITRVRLEGIPPIKIRESIAQLKSHLSLFLGNIEMHYFNNIDKWFRSDVIADLSTIRKAIVQEKDINIRRFFWVCFADTVRKYSNTRSTTFKLHVKEETKIKSMKNDCIEYFVNKISTLYSDYVNDQETIITNLYTGNATDILRNFESNSIDLICTSPPYGDNHTTVTYGQYSILPLLWIDVNDLDSFDMSMLDKFTAIDRMSLGGHYNLNNFSVEIDFEDLISNLSLEKAKKVKFFINDYCKVFVELARVLKKDKKLVLTLGNRRVDNKEFPFDVLNDRLAEKYGLVEEAVLTRNIQGKRMPIRVSNIPNHGAVKSMSKEYVKIYRKVLEGRSE